MPSSVTEVIEDIIRQYSADSLDSPPPTAPTPTSYKGPQPPLGSEESDCNTVGSVGSSTASNAQFDIKCEENWKMTKLRSFLFSKRFKIMKNCNSKMWLLVETFLCNILKWDERYYKIGGLKYDLLFRISYKWNGSYLIQIILNLPNLQGNKKAVKFSINCHKIAKKGFETNISLTDYHSPKKETD